MTAEAERTRKSLHAVATYVLAGAQYDRSGTIRLRVDDDGVATVADPALRITGAAVVGAGGEVSIAGHSARSLGDAVGVTARSLDDVFPDGPGVGLDDVLEVDGAAASALVAALATGAAALAAFAPEEAVVLWPEHFDVGISRDEVNYGVSPGDATVAEPYAYVGPWSVPPADDFWTESFGAARPMSSFADADAVAAFFEEGRARLDH